MERHKLVIYPLSIDATDSILLYMNHGNYEFKFGISKQSEGEDVRSVVLNEEMEVIKTIISNLKFLKSKKYFMFTLNGVFYDLVDGVLVDETNLDVKEQKEEINSIIEHILENSRTYLKGKYTIVLEPDIVFNLLNYYKTSKVVAVGVPSTIKDFISKKFLLKNGVRNSIFDRLTLYDSYGDTTINALKDLAKTVDIVVISYRGLEKVFTDKEVKLIVDSLKEFKGKLVVLGDEQHWEYNKENTVYLNMDNKVMQRVDEMGKMYIQTIVGRTSMK